jgi:hypothetical protein
MVGLVALASWPLVRVVIAQRRDGRVGEPDHIVGIHDLERLRWGFSGLEGVVRACVRVAIRDRVCGRSDRLGRRADVPSRRIELSRRPHAAV